MYSANNNYRLVGHAAKYFDFPYLSKRFIINELDIPDILDTVHLKPWETKKSMYKSRYLEDGWNWMGVHYKHYVLFLNTN